ncbi:MAG: hypothetical protein IPF54_26520 [Draconibacterium sp.]|nr:hypothetical protein [Draconibacterium sp.]
MGGATERANEQAKALKDLNILTDAYTEHLETLNNAIKDSNTLTLEQKRLMAESSAEMIGAIENTIRLQNSNKTFCAKQIQGHHSGRKQSTF